MRIVLYKLAFSPYGYWIKPDGERIPVMSEAGHCDALQSAQQRGELAVGEDGYYDEWGEGCDDLYDTAFAAGWARLVVYGGPTEPGVVQMKQRPNDQQILSISSIMDEQRKKNCYVNIPGVNGEFDVMFDLDKALKGRLKGRQLVR